MNSREDRGTGLLPESGTQPRVELAWRPQTFSHVISSGPQMEHLNAVGGIAVGFTGLRHHPVHLAFEGGQSETLCIWRTSSKHGFSSVPKIAADLFTLRFVTAGAMIRNNRYSESVIARVDYGTFIDFEGMRDDEASPGFSAISATVTRAKIIEASVALEESSTASAMPFAPVVELKTLGLRALRQTLISLHQRLRGAERELDLLAPMLEELLVHQLISAWPMHGGTVSSGRPASTRALWRAIDYIEANLAGRMTMAEIASAAGIGVRALQLAFKREFGCSPFQYLINRRLDQVHAALQTKHATTIRAVATQWGFVHMSDFARRYRLRFGHLPSTLPSNVNPLRS